MNTPTALAWVEFDGLSFKVLTQGARGASRVVCYSVNRAQAVSRARGKGYSLPHEPMPMITVYNTSDGTETRAPEFEVA